MSHRGLGGARPALTLHGRLEEGPSLAPAPRICCAGHMPRSRPLSQQRQLASAQESGDRRAERDTWASALRPPPCRVSNECCSWPHGQEGHLGLISSPSAALRAGRRTAGGGASRPRCAAAAARSPTVRSRWPSTGAAGSAVPAARNMLQHQRSIAASRENGHSLAE